MDIAGESYEEELTQEAYLIVTSTIATVLAIIAKRLVSLEGMTHAEARAHANKDIAAITKALQEGSKKAGDAASRAIISAALDNDELMKPMYAAKKVPFVPLDENPVRLAQVEKAAEEAAKAARNLVLKAKMPFAGMVNNPSKAYRLAVDTATLSVSTGQKTLNKAVTSTIKELSKGRLVGVEMASGRMVRIDSLIRRDIYTGSTQLLSAIREEQGAEFGADGVEISAHSTSAPDHAPFQGKQYATGSHKVVNGIKYPSFERMQAGLERAFESWNCTHIVFPIVLGLNRPTYSKDELRTMVDRSEEVIGWTGISGKHMEGSRYQATQYQRGLESSIRSRRFELTALDAAGIDDAAVTSRVVKTMETQYRNYSRSVGLTPNMLRTQIA